MCPWVAGEINAVITKLPVSTPNALLKVQFSRGKGDVCRVK